MALGWNCQGLGNPRSVGALRNIVRRWDPEVVFLSETKIRVAGMKRIKMKLGFVNGLYVQSQRKSGGLALFWRKDVNLEIKSYSRHHIDAVVAKERSGFKWRLTGFYGHPETHQRKESWRYLDTLNLQFNLPWLCFGDFNEIISGDEKRGGALRPQRQMDAFRNIINKCGFKDLGYLGFDFTWCNQQEGSDRIYLRLDRAFATLDWIEHFSNVRVQHLDETTLDHCPLLLADSVSSQKCGKHRFFFEAIWTRRADYKELMKEVWNSNTVSHDPSSLSAGLKVCADRLAKWGSSVFWQIPKKIQEKKERLGELLRNDTSLQNGAEINELRKEINIMLDDEEVWWHQRSRVQWLGEGDRNTKYFHHRASERRRKNAIVGLWNDEGIWCDSKEDIVRTVLSYF